MLGSIVQVRPQQPFPLKIQECRNVLQEEISGPYRNAHQREYSARDCAGKILKKLRVDAMSKPALNYNHPVMCVVRGRQTLKERDLQIPMRS